jgi:hypothetical protein
MVRRGVGAVLVAAVVATLLAGCASVASTLGDPPRPAFGRAAPSPVRPIASTAAPFPNAPALPLRPGRVPTAADPLRVMIVGDSLMYDASPGIKAALESTGVVRVSENAVLGFGLVWGWPWRTQWPRMVAEERPELVLAMLGTWDHDAAIGHGGDWYRGLVDEAAAILVSGGARLVWTGYPRVRSTFHTFLKPDPNHPSSHSEVGRQFIDAVFATLPATFPGRVSYLLLDPVLDAPGGQYSSYLQDDEGAMVLARKRDGAHFCPFGSERVGRYIAAAVQPVFALPPIGTTWFSGAWRSEGRYFNPPDGCVDDRAGAGMKSRGL